MDMSCQMVGKPFLILNNLLSKLERFLSLEQACFFETATKMIAYGCIYFLFHIEPSSFFHTCVIL